MSFDFLNPWMLLGLTGISLPIIAHLLSKKKYEIVQWGAMQFLELGRETRRRVRLEEFLLLLLRILMIGLIAFWMSRPWASGGVFRHLVAAQPRDVVLVIDSSFSMGWEDGVRTPHQRAIDWAEEFLGELHSGDTVALLDARDQVRDVIGKPTRDFDWVREELDKLPPPSGTSNLAEACSRGIQILGQTTNLSREVIVITDAQSRCWSTGDASRWLRFDELRKQPTVLPRIWVVNVGDEIAKPRTNFTVGAIKLSRELTVTDFPIRISTTIRSSGGSVPVSKRVNLEIDGRVIPERAISVQLEPNGETTVEFEHRFATVGSYVVGVSVDGDALPGDNRSHAALLVAEALPALLVDGDDQLDPTRDETFFARAALSPPRQATPWVRAERATYADWNIAELDRYAAVILANVEQLTPAQIAALRHYVDEGGGLLWALGNRCRADFYNGELAREGLFPGRLTKVGSVPAPPPGATDPAGGIYLDDDSLELPWLTHFRLQNDGTLPETRFQQWWEIDLSATAPAPSASGTPRPAPVVAARLSTGSPLLIASDLGRGRILTMTSPLDADWSTLPTRTDYVPLLHEMVFFLASSATRRNVVPGVPLLLPVAADFVADDFAFYTPQGTEVAVKLTGSTQRKIARLNDTSLSGVYSLERKPRDSDPATRQYFVVDFDRGESDLTPLDETELAFLKKDGRMEFLRTLDELRAGILTDTSRAELWPWVLFFFLGMLVFEVWMTRRLVRGGHSAVDELPPEAEGELIPQEAILEVEEFEEHAAGAVPRGRTYRDSF